MRIDLNELKRDPKAVLERLAAQPPPIGAIRPQVEAWVEQRRRIASLRREKQEIAVAFRSRPVDPTVLADLKTRMSVATDFLVEAEHKLKRLESELLASTLDEAGDPRAAASNIPERFTLGVPVGEAPVALSFERLSSANRGDWDAFVTAEPRASLYHHSHWESWVTGVLRQHSMCLLARVGGQVVGVLPLYALRSRLFGAFAVSVPYVNYGGPLGVNSGVETALLARARREAEVCGLRHMEIRETRARDGWLVRSDKVSMLRALPSTLGQLEDQLGAKVRSQIRRSARQGAVFRSGNEERLLRDFYEVFARNMRDLGTPVYARRVFENLVELLRDNVTVLVAYVNGQPGGAAFLLRYRDTMEIPWASTLRQYNSESLNMQMYWQALGHAIDSGCRYFDFGRSTEGSGTFRFKKQWGAEPVPHCWNYWLREGARAPSLTPDNPRFRFLIECWKRLPLFATKMLGPMIVRSLP
jgi:serine/alanine adding enzyme